MIQLVFTTLLFLSPFLLSGQDFQNSKQWKLDQFLWSHSINTKSLTDKPPLDFLAIDNWMQVGPDDALSISSDGRFCAYGIHHVQDARKIDSIIVQSIDGSWRKAFCGAAPGLFSSDSRFYILKDQENLYFLLLGTDTLTTISRVNSIKSSKNLSSSFFAYQLKGNERRVLLRNFVNEKQTEFFNAADYGFDQSGKWFFAIEQDGLRRLSIYNLAEGGEIQYSSVEKFSFSSNGSCLILQTLDSLRTGTERSLKFVNFSGDRVGYPYTIWSTTDSNVIITKIIIEHGKQVAFLVRSGFDSQKNGINSVWYFNEEMEKALIKLEDKSGKLNEGLLIQEVISFSDNGRYINLSLIPQPKIDARESNVIDVDIWSFRDSLLQSTQSHLKEEATVYRAIYSIEEDRIVIVESDFEKLAVSNGDFAVSIRRGDLVNGDRYWTNGYNENISWLVSLKTGSRKRLPTKGGPYTFWFSPAGKYLVYFDMENNGNYISYNLATDREVNISRRVPFKQLVLKHRFSNATGTRPCGVAGWLSEDSAVLVYDNFDVWRLDLANPNNAVNLTNGYGQRRNISFSLMSIERSRPYCQDVFNTDDTLLLRAFNFNDKHSGFYSKVVNSNREPVMLSMGPHFTIKNIGNMGGIFDDGMDVKKAAKAEQWIVKRQSSTDAPNYSTTSDFKLFKPLSDLQPQKKYNWLKSELHTFNKIDGGISQGILYKPENFDPSKKYPVIISFYFHLTDGLYQFPPANYLRAPIIGEVPWFVSHGYIVFRPDIYFQSGQWGPSAVNVIDGVAKYLRTLPFIDGNSLGVVGHSNSGLTGYYLLVHSNSFAAMSIGAAATDRLSSSLSLGRRAEGKTFSLKYSETLMDFYGLGNLWKNKKSWLDHTTVLVADKVTSPLLMFQNKDDGVPVEQAAEMFVSLFRLEKKVWWLQYDKGGHVLWTSEDKRDYTIRSTQFFDHYLKNAPAPTWMTRGVPAKLKGTEPRYDLDVTGNCGLKDKRCAVCTAWNDQFRRHPKMFSQSISDWELDDDIKGNLRRQQDSVTRANSSKAKIEHQLMLKKMKTSVRK